MPETSMWSSTPSRAERRLWPAANLALPLALSVALSLGLTSTVLASTGNSGAGTAAQQMPGNGSHPLLPGSRLQGQAMLRFFGLQVYHAHLWTRSDFRPEQLEQQPLVLELHYLRDFKGSAIAERSLQEMRRAGGIGEEQGQRWLAEMQRLFPDVKAGDRITGVHVPGSGARFYLNGRLLGAVEDDAFSRLFFGIWLSPRTSQPRMRETLLQSVAGASPRTP